jgi:hydrogenase-4 transcriptional activator
VSDLHELWREASLHLDLASFVDRAAVWLGGRLPIAGLRVWRLRRDGRTLLADGDRLDLDAAHARALTAWLAANDTCACPGGATPQAALAPLLATVPVPSHPADVVAVPLPGEPGARGVLLVLLRGGVEADQAVCRLCAELQEPFAAALENDRRLRELTALRRAAEADRSSLLARLGRKQMVDDVVGVEGGLAGVMERVGMVAGSDLPVLILGETGSGKEVVARAVHTRSRRANGPFTRVNCGAIPADLVDSELFGHEKGSFTGAVGRRRGWFEQSDRGTLLLDEVADLPKAAQVRLLRVLQDGLITRVGGESALSVDVRVIAATNADLPAMVQRGEFRADLWYRLAVFPLVLPPLRERAQDIPALVEMLVQRASRHFGLRPPAATPADLALLAAYDWPGNVRELGSVIDRAVILGGGKRLEVAKALGHAGSAAPRAAAPGEPAVFAPVESTAFVAGTSAPATLDEAMARHIRSVLAATQGRIEGPHGAAKLLKINPHTLRARMRKLGIEWQAFRPER